MPSHTNNKAAIQHPIGDRPRLQTNFDVFVIELCRSYGEYRWTWVSWEDSVDQIMNRKQATDCCISSERECAFEIPRTSFASKASCDAAYSMDDKGQRDEIDVPECSLVILSAQYLCPTSQVEKHSLQPETDHDLGGE